MGGRAPMMRGRGLGLHAHRLDLAAHLAPLAQDPGEIAQRLGEVAAGLLLDDDDDREEIGLGDRHALVELADGLADRHAERLSLHDGAELRFSGSAASWR